VSTKLGAEDPYLLYDGLEDGRPLGRDRELTQLQRIAANLGSLHFLLKGPRGVGKTTLLRSLQETIGWKPEKVGGPDRPLVLRLPLTALDTPPQLVERIKIVGKQLARLAEKHGAPESQFNPLRRILSGIRKATSARTLTEVGAKITEGLLESDADAMYEGSSALADFDSSVDYFCSVVRAVYESLSKAVDLSDSEKVANKIQLDPISGIVIVLDEADTVTIESFRLATFVKLACEQFAASQPKCPVSFIVSGLDDVDSKLLSDHPSALRLLELVELEPFPINPPTGGGPNAAHFVRALLSAGCLRSAAHWPNEAEKLLTKLSEGFPFWVIRIAYYSRAASISRAPLEDPPRIEIEDVLSGYERALREVARAACTSATSDDRTREAKRLISCLTISGQRELEKNELLRIAGLQDEAIEERALREVTETEAVRTRRTSAGTMIGFVADGYQRWLHEEMSALDMQDSMPSLTQALHDLEHEVTFFGENVPAFDGVQRLLTSVTRRLGFPEREPKVRFGHFSHEELFTTLGRSPIVDRLGVNAEVREPRSTVTLNLPMLWEAADVLAIPAYLLSEAYRMGVVNLDELTSGLAESRSWKRYLESSTVGFFKTCVFNGRWIALPFTLVPKVYYTPGDEPVDGILFEGKLRSLSLSYLFSDFIRRREKEAVFEISRSRMDVAVSGSYRLKAERLEQLLREFKGIIQATDSHLNDLEVPAGITWDFLASSERVVGKMRERRLSYYGWADWFVKQTDRAGFRVSAMPPLRSEKCKTLPAREDGRETHAADAWVLVFPKNRLTRPERDPRVSLRVFRIFMALMGPDWQAEFQEQTGASPFRSVLKSTRGWRKFAWLRDLDPDNIELISSGDPFDHFVLQAQTALVSEYISSNGDDTLLRWLEHPELNAYYNSNGQGISTL